MAYKSIMNGFLFVEGFEESLQVIGPIEYKKSFGFNHQLKNLDDIKLILIEQAKAMGANAIIHFEYGQKTVGFWKSIFLRHDDNVNWFAKGLAVYVDPKKIEEMINASKR